MLFGSVRVRTRLTIWGTAAPAPVQVLEQVRTGPVAASLWATTAEARSAADALTAALRQDGRAKLVMGDEALGPLGGLSDEQVLAKAKSTVADLFLVVRVFANSTGQPATAVATFYDRAGKVLSALTASAGTPLVARAGEGAAQGVNRAALSSVADLQKDAPTDESRKRYDDNFVSFQDVAGVNRYGMVVSTWQIPTQGKFRRPLEGADFYDHVGRADLGGQFRSRNARRWALFGVGLGAQILSVPLLTVGVVNGYCAKKSSQSFECLESDYTGLILGGVLFTAGTIVELVGLATDPHPVDPPERRALADTYNQKLRTDNGLPPETSRAAPASAPRVDVGAYVNRSGAGFGLTVQL